MGAFTRISADAFNDLQLDAGVLLSSFDPSSPVYSDDAIICATTGGVNPQAIPTYSDMGEDVDNCPNNTKEFKKLDGWDCKFATTALNVDADTIRLALGAADKVGNRIVPRRDLKQSDFQTIWWVGDRADGGYVAIKLMNALSTGGFALQSTKNGKGQISLELSGHFSVNAQNKVPMEFYSADPVEFTVSNTLSHATNNNTAVKAAYGSKYLAAISPATGYTLTGATVSVTMGGTNITSTAYDGGIIVIDEVTGAIVITVTAVAV